MTPSEKQPEETLQFSPECVSTESLEWFQQFLKHLDLFFLDRCRELSNSSQTEDAPLTAIRAFIETLSDSGMESEKVIQLLGQVAIEHKTQSSQVEWTDKLNQRRFELIDRDLQGELSAAEQIELAGLTQIMRDDVDSELNLPMKGAKALHRELLKKASQEQGE